MGRRDWEMRKPTGWLKRGLPTGWETGLDAGLLWGRPAGAEPPKRGRLLWLEAEWPLGRLL